MKEYPRCVSSIITKLNSSFGLHTVYIVNTNIGIKIGYTINTIQQRLNEGRYKEQIILKSILRDDRFPALGAFDFEKELKNKYSQYRNLNSNTTAPGKNEIYYFKFEKNILKIYDELKNKYKHKRGFKRAN